jgi:hypothetical protein
VSASFQQPISCALAEERLMLRLYDELPPEEAEALDAHLAGCENCRRELAALRALGETLASEPADEPSQPLLAATRERLDAALDEAALQKTPLRESFIRRYVQPIFAPLQVSGQGFRAAPFAVAAMLLAGVGAGGFSGYKLGVKAHPVAAATKPTELVPVANSPIASVSGIARQADGKNVMVRYNRLVPESVTGSADDPNIRQLLAMGIQNPTGPEVQDDAARTLADSCTHGPECDDMRLRGALLTAARYDGDAQLRSKALNSLEPYVAEDMRVRDMALYSLTHDASNQVRSTAMEMLHPVEADSSVREVLQNVSNSDHDPAIRSQSERMSRDASDIGLQIQ